MRIEVLILAAKECARLCGLSWRAILWQVYDALPRVINALAWPAKGPRPMQLFTKQHSRKLRAVPSPITLFCVHSRHLSVHSPVPCLATTHPQIQWNVPAPFRQTTRPKVTCHLPHRSAPISLIGESRIRECLLLRSLCDDEEPAGTIAAALRSARGRRAAGARARGPVAAQPERHHGKSEMREALSRVHLHDF